MNPVTAKIGIAFGIPFKADFAVEWNCDYLL
jgi:hypothetical protein